MNRPDGTPLLAFEIGNDDGECSSIAFGRSAAIVRATEEDEAVVKRASQYDRYSPGPVPAEGLLTNGWYLHCSDTQCQRRISYDDDMWAMPAGHDHIAEEAIDIVASERRAERWLAQNPKPPEPDDREPWGERMAKNRAIEDWRRDRPNDTFGPRAPRLDMAALRFHGSDVYCNLACERNSHLGRMKIDLAHEDAEKEAEKRWPGAPSYTSGRWPNLTVKVWFQPAGLQDAASWQPPNDYVEVSQRDLPAWESMITRIEAAKDEG